MDIRIGATLVEQVAVRAEITNFGRVGRGK